jgi:D-glycero-beta-D-manno-heptose 1-phosphate adenylyltransferase
MGVPLINQFSESMHILESWRRLSKTIVFTNGCFDIIHAGHIDLLRRCASSGDKLVIGLNSDESVKRIKGNNRPINNQKNRSMILEAIKYIDLVVIFDEDTPYNLINSIRPDILIKGGDWSPDKIVGRDIVESYGGKVLSLPLLEGHSTTNLLERIKSR